MAIICPKCGAEFDSTLFEFGNRVRCDCGTEVEYPGADLLAGHVADDRHEMREPSEGIKPIMLPTLDRDQFRTDYVHRFQRIVKNTTPGDARFLRILIESSGAKLGLEIGTATGYGAIVMGLGFERTGGHLTSIDCDAEMVKSARSHIREMQLPDVVTVMEGAALDVIPTLEGPFDFVFIDALKEEYLRYFRAVEPRLAPKAIIVADNVIKQADRMQDFLDAMGSAPGYQTVVIRASEEKSDGMAVIYKGA